MSRSLLSFRQFLARSVRSPALAEFMIELSLAVLQRVVQPVHPPTPSGVFTMKTSRRFLKPAAPSTRLFLLGRLVATPRALSILAAQGIPPVTLLERHARGDWGELDGEDVQANQEALAHGWRLFSSYAVGKGIKVWVITEADRSVTTILMPDDY